MNQPVIKQPVGRSIDQTINYTTSRLGRQQPQVHSSTRPSITPPSQASTQQPICYQPVHPSPQSVESITHPAHPSTHVAFYTTLPPVMHHPTPFTSTHVAFYTTLPPIMHHPTPFTSTHTLPPYIPTHHNLRAGAGFVCLLVGWLDALRPSNRLVYLIDGSA